MKDMKNNWCENVEHFDAKLLICCYCCPEFCRVVVISVLSGSDDSTQFVCVFSISLSLLVSDGLY